MERIFGASVNLYSKPAPLFYAAKLSLYITTLFDLVCSKVEEVAIENHKD